MTYSVCSLSRAEGPDLVARLASCGMRRAPAGPVPAGGVLTEEGDLLLLPHRSGGDGFYVARIVGA